MPPRGSLKIFLGYAAGVGKTYSMLEMAHVQARMGRDVVVGVVVTHGRHETESLSASFEKVPLLPMVYKSVTLHELDVEGIIRRKPDLVLIDELAHTNVAGARHPKRYMDVKDILHAGIDVYTTLNIQHIESFHDAIEVATHVAVKERVPDIVLDEADELELIDVPPQTLIERLQHGHVYLPEQAVRAQGCFFKIETLQLLREMALRKVAAIVDAKRASEHALAPRLLTSIGPSPFSEQVVRMSKRLVDMLHAEWLVISVETPYVRSEEECASIARHSHLAETLGAKVCVVPGESIADTIFAYAKAHGVTQIVLGHSRVSWWKRLLYPSPVDELVHRDNAIDVYVISSKQRDMSQQNITVRQMKRTYSLLTNIIVPLGLVGMLFALLFPLLDLVILS